MWRAPGGWRPETESAVSQWGGAVPQSDLRPADGGRGDG